MNTAAGVMPALTPAQGFPETNKSLHVLAPHYGTGTDPRTPSNNSPSLAPGGLAATLRKSPSRDFAPGPTSPENPARTAPSTVCNLLCQNTVPTAMPACSSQENLQSAHTLLHRQLTQLAVSCTH